jgi:hypothetical protein
VCRVAIHAPELHIGILHALLRLFYWGVLYGQRAVSFWKSAGLKNFLAHHYSEHFFQIGTTPDNRQRIGWNREGEKLPALETGGPYKTNRASAVFVEVSGPMFFGTEMASCL